jgi:outer membrane protein
MRCRLTLVFLAACGCSDIEQARRAQDPESRRPGERTATAAQLGLGPGSVLTVDQGVHIALTTIPPIAISRARVEGSRARLEQIDAGFLPTVSVSADYRWEKNGGAGSTPLAGSKIGKASGVIQTHGESVQVSQLLYDFGKTAAVRREAWDNYVASQSDLQAAEDDAVFSFKQSFFGVLRQEELVRVGEETVRQFEKRLEQVRGFVDVGARQKYDLTKAQVDLGNAQLALVKARTALTVSKATLNNAIGLAEEPRYAIEKPPSTPPWTVPIEDALDQARRYHPRLQALLLREGAARHAIDASIADFWPELTLNGSVSASGSLTPVTWFSSLGPALNWVVFSGWEKTGALHGAVSALREAYAIRAQEEQLIYLELHQAYAVLEDTQESLKILDLTVKQAEESLLLVTGRYEQQKASSVELTDAQVALANARAADIQARYDFEIAVAAIQRSMGGVKK